LLKHEDKIEFQIYESSKQFLEVGAGLGVWGRGMEVFKEAGLYEECIKAAVKPDPNDPGKPSLYDLLLAFAYV
jgi:2-polyprenyl-6-methoxyphenol hydroxylase-like FAD-dependent oxidoreductase